MSAMVLLLLSAAGLSCRGLRLHVMRNFRFVFVRFVSSNNGIGDGGNELEMAKEKLEEGGGSDREEVREEVEICEACTPFERSWRIPSECPDWEGISGWLMKSHCCSKWYRPLRRPG